MTRPGRQGGWLRVAARVGVTSDGRVARHLGLWRPSRQVTDLPDRPAPSSREGWS